MIKILQSYSETLGGVAKEPSIFEVWSEAKEMMQGGGILSFTALVICGNGDGVAGFGKGKSAEISAAVDKVCLLFVVFLPITQYGFFFY